MTAHWGDAYYGALYLDTVEDLLTPRLSALEAEVVAALLEVTPADRVLDAGCGHGRHARVLSGRVGRLVGMDRNRDYLRRATAARPAPPAGAPTYVRADVRALPFREGAFDAAYSWYSSLFMFDDATNAACLAGLARAVRTGGRVLVHHANPFLIAAAPHDEARRTLPDGSVVEEVSDFDPASGVDRCRRRLARTDGRVLEATAELRYYMPSEWRQLAHQAGLRIVKLTSTTAAAEIARPELGPEAPDLIALLEKT